LGAGLHISVDGKKVSTSATLSPLLLKGVVPLKTTSASKETVVPVNYAVNNDGHYFPRLTASHTAAGSSLAKLNDGNYWYLRHPPNRWTAESSPNEKDWIEIDLGVERKVHTIKLYVLDDRELRDSKVRAPRQIELEYWDGKNWKSVEAQKVDAAPQGHRPHVFTLAPLPLQKLRVNLLHTAGYRSGLSEIEVWGDAVLPLAPVPVPAGNIAFNDGRQEYPRATASHHDRFGGVPKSAIDGITNFLPNPTNRWTSYESKTPTDWLEVDFGKPMEFRRVDLAIYDDRGGVQAPLKVELEAWNGDSWQTIKNVKRSPEKPAGSEWNSVVFEPITSTKVRVIFTNAGQARSGVTEMMVWNE
jgi:hypothetical protein